MGSHLFSFFSPPWYSFYTTSLGFRVFAPRKIRTEVKVKVFPFIVDESEDSEDDFAHWEEYMKRFHILMKVSGH